MPLPEPVSYSRPHATRGPTLERIRPRDRPVSTKKSTPPKPLGDVLKRPESEGLAYYMRRAGALEQVAARVRELVPKSLAAQVHLGDIKDGRLSLIVPTAAIASRIRLDARRLATGLADCGFPVNEVVARISPTFRPPAVPQPSAPQALPDAARAALLQLASSGDPDDPLMQSIRRLADVGRDRS